MSIFDKFYNLNNTRISWLILLVSCVSFLGAGFFFQYVMGLEPCHLCIIQRIAFLIIALSAVIAILNPIKNFIRYSSNILWFLGSSLGLYGGIKLVYTQMFPPENDLFGSCSLGAQQLMDNYPFLEWFPMMFEAKGSCTNSAYSFFRLVTMEQVTLLIFVVLFLCSLASIISLFKHKN